MIDGDGWKDGQRAREGETRKGYSKWSPTPPSLASGGRRGMTDCQGQGGDQLDHSPLGDSPINTLDSWHGWCLVFQGCCGHRHLLVLLALVPPQQANGGRWEWEKKAVPGLEPHRLYQESSQPGVGAASSRGWLTHTS